MCAGNASQKIKGGEDMSTTYYICRRQDYERSKAIIDYVDKIRRTLHSYLDSSLPPELKEDLQLIDDLEDAVAPMCSKLNEHVGYDPEVRLCTVTRDKVVWHREEVESAGLEKTDELIVIDEYGKTMTLEELHSVVGCDK